MTDKIQDQENTNTPSLYSKRYGETKILIELSKFRLTFVYQGEVYGTYPIAIGKSETPTPIGNWRIINKQINPGGIMGTRWMGFRRDGYGIHGTTLPWSIGTRASKGCVRMYNQDVEKIFPLVQIGTPVIIVD